MAARDVERAKAFAAKHGILRTYDSYAALLADPEIDAVYIPLPNGLHGEWAIAAMNAGKHVLCEKPIAANAQEAQAMARTAEETGRVLMEAFHYRYHPLAQRIADIAASGELGKIEHIYSTMCFPLPVFSDIRYRFDLAGGADDGRGMLCRAHGAAGRRPLPRGGFRHGEAARPECRPRYGGGASVPVRRLGPCLGLDVVEQAAERLAPRCRQ